MKLFHYEFPEPVNFPSAGIVSRAITKKGRQIHYFATGNDEQVALLKKKGYEPVVSECSSAANAGESTLKEVMSAIDGLIGGKQLAFLKKLCTATGMQDVNFSTKPTMFSWLEDQAANDPKKKEFIEQACMELKNESPRSN